jgi:hypothetical protein
LLGNEKPEAAMAYSGFFMLYSAIPAGATGVVHLAPIPPILSSPMPSARHPFCGLV